MKSRNYIPTLLSLIFLVLATACNGSGLNKSGDFSSPVLEFLRYVPDNEIYREWIAYGDSSAWFSAWNIVRPESGDFRELESPDFATPIALSAVWQRQTYPPESLGFKWLASEDQVSLLGFNALLLDRYMEAGLPPESIAVAEFNFDRKQIGDALSKLGYKSDVMDGGTLYSIRGDHEMDIKSPIKSIQFASLNRILLTDRKMIVGSATDVINNAQSAYTKETPSLADNTTYIAISQALADGSLGDYGKMVSVVLISGPTINEQINRATQNLPASQSVDDFQHTLSAFDLAGFATFQSGKTSFLTLVLVFPKGGTNAQSAADVVAERLENYTSIATKGNLGDIWSLEKTTGLKINDLPVAIIVMRSEADAVQSVEGNSLRVFTWSHLILRQDILFLKTTP